MMHCIQHANMKVIFRLVGLAVIFTVSSIPRGLGSPCIHPTSLPLCFEANGGQVDPTVQFLSRGRGHALYLTPGGAVLAVNHARADENGALARGVGDGANPSSVSAGRRLQMEPKAAGSGASILQIELLGANPATRMVGLAELPGKVNYLRGHVSTKWRTNVATYGQVRCEQVYHGIDLVYYGGSRQELEYDFVVAPGADPGLIRFNFSGADRVEMADNGDLVLHLGDREVRQHKPRLYQLVNGEQREVPGGYSFLDDAGSAADDPAIEVAADPVGHDALTQGQVRVAFTTGAYDHARPLVIDPVLTFSSYIGGSLYEDTADLTVDAAGNVFVIGTTFSSDMPLTNALDGTLDTAVSEREIYIAKLAPGGTNLVFATFLGGKETDDGYAVTTDREGNIYLLGDTWSYDFPLTNGYQTSVDLSAGPPPVLVKLDPSGSQILYATTFASRTTAAAIAAGAAGRVWIAGATAWPTLPVKHALQPAFGGGGTNPQDAFFACFDTTRTGEDSLICSSYFGGSGNEGCLEVALDKDGDVLLVGATSSTNFPVVNAFQPAFGGGDSDGFVAKLSPDGSSLLYSTYLGGGGRDLWEVAGIAMDADGSAVIAGFTLSTNFPTTPDTLIPAPVFDAGGTSILNSFVAKLSPQGGLTFGSYTCSAVAVALDPAGYIYLVGGVGRPEAVAMPRINSLPLELSGGRGDTWVMKLDPDGQEILYTAQVGGTDGDGGRSIALDPEGSVWVSGATISTNFPVRNALQAAYGGGYDGFIFALAPDPDTNAPRLITAFSQTDPERVEVVFSKPLDLASATNLANYTLEPALAVQSIVMGANSKTVRLEIQAPDPGTDYTLRVAGVLDRANPPNAIVAGSERRILHPAGCVTWKQFLNLPGGAVDSLSQSARFPDEPDGVSYPASLEWPFDAHAKYDAGYQPPGTPDPRLYLIDNQDNYGVQFQGFVIPPVTGEYTFHLCAGGQGVLYLSTDEQPAHKRSIAREPSGSPSRQWAESANQASRGTPPANVSSPVSLEAGRRYYLEALVKSASGLLISRNWSGPNRFENEAEIRAGINGFRCGQFRAQMFQDHVVGSCTQSMQTHRERLLGEVGT